MPLSHNDGDELLLVVSTTLYMETQKIAKNMQSKLSGNLSLGGEWDEMSDEFVRGGTAIAGGLFCVLWNLNQDSEWAARRLRLEHFGAHRMCP